MNFSGEASNSRLLIFPATSTTTASAWAIALRDGDVVHVVREGKGTTNLDQLPFEMEKTKVLSGAAHFHELGVDYKVVRVATDIR